MNGDPVLRAEGLSIRTPAGARLVDAVSFDLHRGEFVLLVGPSGSGKTSLVNLLCGLLEDGENRWQVSGVLRSGGRSVDLSTTRSDLCGLVFQGNALFDDLTVGENLRIAADHAGPVDLARNDALLSLLADIHPATVVAACSGGQKQRVAIARTMLADHPVLVLDEPNSGLDIKSSRRLAGIVKDICRESGRPAVIVAHHVEDLLPLADKVLLLDSRTSTIRPIPADMETVEREMMALDVGNAGAPSAADAASAAWHRRMRRGSSAKWFARYFAEYFWVLCAAPSMLVYLALGGLIMGFVSIWFGFNYHSFGGYLKSILHDETLAGIGFVQTTVAVPLIASILVVARNSAIISADFSNRTLSSQLRAMHNLNIPALRYLLVSVICANVISLVLLTGVALVTSAWAALQTWWLFFPDQPVEFWQENYFRRLTEAGPALVVEFYWILGKILLSSVLGGLAAAVIGLRRKTSVVSINEAIAQAIVIGVSLTLFSHAAVAIFQFWK
ncbi:ATP-binding cassette domain-containing protein [Arenibaculum sp.]|jgi:ABC-type multidrug transport system ATPase subunit/ABC-type transporter Mla maintaining outer membrane lipid asymmetry permease subunit MlaE|uniref:ATP-binding cassette domain-containing protein n=1 Tax=Arenibaculum sp. TaxID=2865862 RepID=UPI002E15A15F|nr:ATP-binding cassette domain-containing protein [Arenibaculum sp.]